MLTAKMFLVEGKSEEKSSCSLSSFSSRSLKATDWAVQSLSENSHIIQYLQLDLRLSRHFRHYRRGLAHSFHDKSELAWYAYSWVLTFDSRTVVDKLLHALIKRLRAMPGSVVVVSTVEISDLGVGSIGFFWNSTTSIVRVDMFLVSLISSKIREMVL